jgi:hypothetical protein
MHDHTNYYYYMKDCSQKLLLLHERLITQIIIIAWKIDHTNHYYCMIDHKNVIISYKIGSHKLLLFHTRLDHINYYYFISAIRLRGAKINCYWLIIIFYYNYSDIWSQGDNVTRYYHTTILMP